MRSFEQTMSRLESVYVYLRLIELRATSDSVYVPFVFHSSRSHPANVGVIESTVYISRTLWLKLPPLKPQPPPPEPVLVEAGERTTVAVTATAFDERTSDPGCSPDGCTAENTRDSSLDANSRWSCRGDLVGGDGGCCVEYSFEEPQDIVRMDIAFHRGAENVRTLDVFNNGEFLSQIESSGSTLGYQEFVVNTDETAGLSLCLADPETNTRTWLSMTEVGTTVGASHHCFVEVLLRTYHSVPKYKQQFY